ncbi:MAG: hypothetical protein Q4G33_11760 [bacterium]|nr:hypothetical protein [bacterium]
MKEIRTAGTKEFIYSMLWAVFLLFIGRGIINSLPDYKVAGTIAVLISFCVLGFFVMTRYSSRFTYEDTGYSLRINRSIGKRNKEIEFRYEDILYMNPDKPANMPKPRWNMRASVFSHRKCTYIVFGYRGNEQTLIFEPTQKFITSLNQSIKKSKKK